MAKKQKLIPGKVYKWITVVDDRTCQGCLKLNGLEFPTDVIRDFQENSPHIDLGDPEFRCRCTVELIGEKKAGGPVTDVSIVGAIRAKMNELNDLIETAAQMRIQTELTSIDITNVDSGCTIMGHYVKISKIL